MGAEDQRDVVRRILLVLEGFDLQSLVEVYLFGSALTPAKPRDIDVLVVFSDEAVRDDVLRDRGVLMEKLESEFAPIEVDMITFTESELMRTLFLQRVLCLRVWHR